MHREILAIFRELKDVVFLERDALDSERIEVVLMEARLEVCVEVRVNVCAERGTCRGVASRSASPRCAGFGTKKAR